jgi:Phage integrase family
VFLLRFAFHNPCSRSSEPNPRVLRHACGYALANKGHDTRAIQGWLGQQSITSTAVYATLAPNWFKASDGIEWLAPSRIAIRGPGVMFGPR